MRQLKITPSVTARTQTVENYLRDLGKLEMMKLFIDTGAFTKTVSSVVRIHRCPGIYSKRRTEHETLDSTNYRCL